MRIKKVLWTDRFETEKGETIGFLGIAGALKGEPSGLEAAVFAKNLFTGKQVDLQSDSAKDIKDETGATLAYVFLICDTCEGASLTNSSGKTNEFTFRAPLINASNILLEKGYARVDSLHPCVRQGYFKFLEKTARNKKIGMWN